MKRRPVLTASILVLLLAPSFNAFSFQAKSPKKADAGSRLVGTWEAIEEGEVVRLVFKSSSVLVFEEEESAYELVPGAIRIKDPYEGNVDYKYSLKGDILVLTFPEGDKMEFHRAGGKTASSGKEKRNDEPAAGPNQNHLLVGKFMSYSSASSSGGSSSWTRYATFDERGNFEYSSESAHNTQQYDQTGANTGWGVAYGANNGNRGTYRVVGDRILVKFPDGSEGEGYVTERFQDGSIGAFKYDGKVYAR